MPPFVGIQELEQRVISRTSALGTVATTRRQGPTAPETSLQTSGASWRAKVWPPLRKAGTAGGRKQLPPTASRSVLTCVTCAPSMEHPSLENALGVPIPGGSTIKVQAQPRAGGGWRCWLHNDVSAPNGQFALCITYCSVSRPPKSRIPSTRRLRRALLIPKP